VPESVVAFRAKVKHPLESLGYACSFAEDLETDELITGVVSVTVSGPSDDETPVTIGSYSFTVASIEDDEGNTIAAYLAVIFQALAGTAGFDYRVTITVTTNMGNTRTGVCVVQVRDGIPR
jgi:hypothetical protein